MYNIKVSLRRNEAGNIEAYRPDEDLIIDTFDGVMWLSSVFMMEEDITKDAIRMYSQYDC
jgi:hypothetical protein